MWKPLAPFSPVIPAQAGTQTRVSGLDDNLLYATFNPMPSTRWQPAHV
jgi:hypothetical protein